MTTKVLIVNHGPDQVLVRTVQYGPDVEVPPGEKPKVMLDTIIAPQGDELFYVHTNQQLLIGEKRPAVPCPSCHGGLKVNYGDHIGWCHVCPEGRAESRKVGNDAPEPNQS